MYKSKELLHTSLWVLGLVFVIYIMNFVINHYMIIAYSILFLLLSGIAYFAVTHILNYHKEITEPNNQIVQNIDNKIDDQINYIDTLNGYQFENYMVKLLSNIGFKHIKHTELSHDGGLDAVGVTADGKTKVGFQFKHCNDNIGYQSIADTIAGGQLYDTDADYLITTSGYTSDAINNSKQIMKNHPNDNLELLDGADLRYLIKLSIKQINFKPALSMVK